MTEKLIFELSQDGRRGYTLPQAELAEREPEELIPERFLRKGKIGLPQVSESQIARHFCGLAQKNFGVDLGFYPLGSCTMKYNPKINEKLVRLPRFLFLHPYQDVQDAQGILEILYQMEQLLCKVSGMHRVSLQPAAGAHGELTALLMAKAFFEEKKETRDKVLVPDSAHGTNPSSSHLTGFKSIEVKSNESGTIDLDDLKAKVDENAAVMMVTNPNTLGLFEKDILAIAEIIHQAGALLYLDGANLNAFLGRVRPADFGVDLMHFNLHKTFSSPHGGGGPGSGPVGASEKLSAYLPVPMVERSGEGYFLDYTREHSIGKVRSFYGNIDVILKAYCYLRILGEEGLKEVSTNAVLNANYLRERLKKTFEVPYSQERSLHEFVISLKEVKSKTGVTAGDIAKRLLDFGFHPPTMYFPLIVAEALMIEPTETESKETLDEFVAAMEQIYQEAREKPEYVKEAPHNLPIRRLDEVKAARELKVRWQESGD